MVSKKQWIHKKIKAIYSFNPKAGTEKYRYRCPFCNRMTHSKRFMDLRVPEIDADIMLYGGYKGIKVMKSTLNPEMRLRVLEAIKQKIEWIYNKIGGEIEWLKSKSVSIRVAPSISYSMMGGQSIPLRINVARSSGHLKSIKNTKLLLGKQTKQSW